MQYVVAGICLIICVGVIVFGLKVLKESKKMVSKKRIESDTDDDELPNLHP